MIFIRSRKKLFAVLVAAFTLSVVLATNAQQGEKQQSEAKDATMQASEFAAGGCREKDFLIKSMTGSERHIRVPKTQAERCNKSIYLQFTVLQRVTSAQLRRCDGGGNVGPLVRFTKEGEWKRLNAGSLSERCYNVILDGSTGIPPRYTVSGLIKY